MPLLEPTDLDREIFAAQLAPFLPARVIDIHTHSWVNVGRAPRVRNRVATWPSLVASTHPIEDLLETYRLLLPGKEVVPMIFARAMDRSGDITGGNAYVADQVRRHRCHGLLYARPDWSAEELVTQLRTGPFRGVKVYLTLSDPALPADEITIFDFLPHHQLAVLNERGLIVMLHIPRQGRLRDPVNLAQMLVIELQYPNVHLIIAHVGRAYCDEDMGDSLQVLGGETKNMLFDFSANTNATVFAELIRRVGPRRILFGSDLPIVRMRLHRICEHGRYVNLVPKGLYGDVSGDPHMREVDGPAAGRLTYFLYEQLLAFKVAAEAAGLSPADIDDVFCRNAERLLQAAQPLGA